MIRVVEACPRYRELRRSATASLASLPFQRFSFIQPNYPRDLLALPFPEDHM